MFAGRDGIPDGGLVLVPELVLVLVLGDEDDAADAIAAPPMAAAATAAPVTSIDLRFIQSLLGVGCEGRLGSSGPPVRKTREKRVNYVGEDWRRRECTCPSTSSPTRATTASHSHGLSTGNVFACEPR